MCIPEKIFTFSEKANFASWPIYFEVKRIPHIFASWLILRSQTDTTHFVLLRKKDPVYIKRIFCISVKTISLLMKKQILHLDLYREINKHFPWPRKIGQVYTDLVHHLTYVIHFCCFTKSVAYKTQILYVSKAIINRICNIYKNAIKLNVPVFHGRGRMVRRCWVNFG